MRPPDKEVPNKLLGIKKPQQKTATDYRYLFLGIKKVGSKTNLSTIKTHFIEHCNQFSLIFGRTVQRVTSLRG